MGYYSSMFAPDPITADPEKIKLFNEIAHFIEVNSTEKEWHKEMPKTQLSEKAREIIEKAEKRFPSDSPAYQGLYNIGIYMFYRLDSHGFIVCDSDESTDREDRYEIFDEKHCADELLAYLLSFVADNKAYIRFVGEDETTWGYLIDPAKKEEVIHLVTAALYIDENGILHYIDTDDENRKEKLFYPVKERR